MITGLALKQNEKKKGQDIDPCGLRLISIGVRRQVAGVHKIQPIADRVTQHLEIISKTFPTNWNSARGIYD